MILFQNTLLTLAYNPSSDILEINYPDLHEFLLPEIKHSIDILVETVKNYDIKKVLLDSTKTKVSVSQEESREIATYLAVGLMQTRVQKVARVQSSNSDVETTAQSNISHLKEGLSLPFQLQNFTNKADALTWLQESIA